jgi:hypothetical protein
MAAKKTLRPSKPPKTATPDAHAVKGLLDKLKEKGDAACLNAKRGNVATSEKQWEDALHTLDEVYRLLGLEMKPPSSRGGHTRTPPSC